MNMLINFAAFQTGWFSSVLGAAKQMPWLGPVVFLVALAIGWAVFMPILMALAERLDGMSEILDSKKVSEGQPS